MKASSQVGAQLKKAGFEYIENLRCYQQREGDNYGADVVEITTHTTPSVNIFLTDGHSKWCKDVAIKAIRALGAR